MKKYFFLTFLALSISSLSAGCLGLSKKSSRTQEAHMALVDQKILELDQALSGLNLNAQNLGKRVEELAQKTSAIDTNYSKLNTTLDELSTQVATKDSSIKATVSETQKNISDLIQKLRKIEQAKTELQNQRSRITDSEIGQHSEAMKEEAMEMIKETKGERNSEEEKKEEETATGQGKEALQKLLDEALTLYRDGNYKDAIGKWEEALVIDPANLEAKFNIEIAKEKIKPPPEK